MGNKASRAEAKQPENPTTDQLDYAVYLLPNNEDQTLAQAQLLVAAETRSSNAVLLFPEPGGSSGSGGTQKYHACFIRDGHWVQAGKERIEASIGNRNFGHAKRMAPNTIPNYQNIAKAALARAGIQLSPIENLYRHVHEYVLPLHYDTRSQIAVTQTSTTLYSLSKPALKKLAIKKLLQHVIHGEQKKAEIFLKALLKTHPQIFPEIFETKMVITDYANHKIEGTAFRLALGAEDVGIQEGEECMAEMLMRFVREHKDLMPDGEVMLERQYREQFPETEEAKAKAKDATRIKNDSDALHRMLDKLDPNKPDSVSEEECQAVHAIDDQIQKRLRQKKSKNYDPALLHAIEQAVLYADKDKFDAAFDQLKKYLQENGIVQDAAFRFDALKALYQFRNHLESQTKETIKTGKHFNTELLLEAFKLYDENYQRFGGQWDSAKNLVSWRKIIGYIQRFVPACLAQAIHQGVYYIVQNREKLQRLSEFKYNKPYKLLPFDSSSSGVPGYDYACAVSGFRARGLHGPDGPVGVAIRYLFKTYVEQKHQRCKAYATSWKSTEEHSRDEVGLRRN